MQGATPHKKAKVSDEGDLFLLVDIALVRYLKRINLYFWGD